MNTQKPNVIQLISLWIWKKQVSPNINHTLRTSLTEPHEVVPQVFVLPPHPTPNMSGVEAGREGR